jgi:iron complex outermembrane receptor protein
MFARVDNLFNRRTIGSVIVNEGNSRFIETGSDRTASIGLQWRWR